MVPPAIPTPLVVVVAGPLLVAGPLGAVPVVARWVVPAPEDPAPLPAPPWAADGGNLGPAAPGGRAGHWAPGVDTVRGVTVVVDDRAAGWEDAPASHGLGGEGLLIAHPKAKTPAGSGWVQTNVVRFWEAAPPPPPFSPSRVMRGRLDKLPGAGADELLDMELKRAKFRSGRSERPHLAPLAEGSVVAIIPAGYVHCSRSGRTPGGT